MKEFNQGKQDLHAIRTQFLCVYKEYGLPVNLDYPD
jgi:hypothetical protein